MSDWITDMGGLALGSRFRRLSDAMSGEVNKVYKKRNIALNSRHFPVLSLLHKQGKSGLSVTEMAEQLKITHVSVSQTVKQLEKQGYCSRRANKNDERVLQISLTDKANTLLEGELLAVWQVIKTVTEERLNSIDGDFWQGLASAEENLSRYSLSEEILSRLAAQ
jgi:DNA-binding MarR family transcriptional regulator